MGIYRILGFMGIYRILGFMGFNGDLWVLIDFIRFYRVLMDFRGIYKRKSIQSNITFIDIY